jgi:hypothetical protein
MTRRNTRPSPDKPRLRLRRVTGARNLPRHICCSERTYPFREFPFAIVSELPTIRGLSRWQLEARRQLQRMTSAVRGIGGLNDSEFRLPGDRENGSLAAAVYRFLWNVRCWSARTWICSPDARNSFQVLIHRANVVVR